MCGWSYLGLREFTGWWDWRMGPAPGMPFLAVPVEPDDLSTTAALLEVDRILASD